MSNKSLDPTNWWYYFDKTDGGKKVKCKHCTWEKPREKTASTNNLKFHLQKHQEEYSKKLEAERLAEKKRLETERKRANTNTSLTDHFPKIARTDNESQIEKAESKTFPIFG